LVFTTTGGRVRRLAVASCQHVTVGTATCKAPNGLSEHLQEAMDFQETSGKPCFASCVVGGAADKVCHLTSQGKQEKLRWRRSWLGVAGQTAGQ